MRMIVACGRVDALVAAARRDRQMQAQVAHRPHDRVALEQRPVMLQRLLQMPRPVRRAQAAPGDQIGGRDDRFVPFGHGRWLADTIPGAQADLRDDDGHLTVAAQRIGDVHGWLAQHV
jgi:pimeloyl-ACP methyl ester carboxylesterase